MSLAETAYNKIIEKILEGNYLPGDMLSENELANEFGMSRTPIRAAIAKFEDQGLFVSYKNRGVLFKEVTRVDVTEGLEVTYALISYIFDSRPKEQINFNLDELEKVLNLQLEAEVNNDYVSYVQNSQAFNRILIEAGNNAKMLQIFDNNVEVAILLAVINYKLNPQQTHYSANELNKKLFEVIKAGAYDQIKTILFEHHEKVRLRSFNERRI